MKPFKPIPPAPFDKKHPLCAVVASLLHEVRLGHDISRADLAEGINISEEMIRLVETHACVFRLDRAIRHSEGLGLPLSDTLREAEARARGR